MLRYIISSTVLAATRLHKSERNASFPVKPVVHQGFNIRCASQNSFFSRQPINLHPRTRVSFPVTFLSSASRSLTSVSPRTCLLRTTVEAWKTFHLVDWLRKNTDLPLEDIQLVERSNLSGIDVMNLLISSFDKLRERYPGASFKLWRAFLQIRLATCMPTSLSTEAPTAGEYQLKLPFVGRQAAITTALPHVRGHVASARARSSSPLSRGGNERLFAIGAAGIGKTRFGYEFPRLLKENDPTLKAKLEKVRTVRITFQSDMAINPKVDKKWRTETDQVNWILTSRAIFTTYDVGTTYKEWATTLAGLIGDVLPPDFNMETFTKELIAIDKPTAIYYHMDEVQAVLNEPAIGGDLICQLSFLYASENKEDMLTLLLYTGTTLSGIKELVRTVKVGKSADFPIISLPLNA